MTEKEREICESLGWIVHEYPNGDIELENSSPKGEDIIIGLSEDDNFLHEIYMNCINFDVDEHVEMWIPYRGSRGCPSSISALVKDAEDIQDMLQILLNELQKGVL